VLYVVEVFVLWILPKFQRSSCFNKWSVRQVVDSRWHDWSRRLGMLQGVFPVFETGFAAFIAITSSFRRLCRYLCIMVDVFVLIIQISVWTNCVHRNFILLPCVWSCVHELHDWCSFSWWLFQIGKSQWHTLLHWWILCVPRSQFKSSSSTKRCT